MSATVVRLLDAGEDVLDGGGVGRAAALQDGEEFLVAGEGKLCVTRVAQSAATRRYTEDTDLVKSSQLQ